jgi:RNA polymerase sigma-70 factor (ECF subfamily)
LAAAVGKETLDVTSLVNQARQGSRASFQKLIVLFQEDIYKMLYFRTFSQLDAEDLTQEVFVQAYKKIASLKEAERFRSWLYSIALNRCRDFKRKEKYLALLGIRSVIEKQTLDGDDRHTAHIQDDFDRQMFWRQVKSMLGDLTVIEREVFTLRFMDQLKLNEIAKILSKSESTVKTHLYRALEKVKKQSSALQEFRESLL